MGSVPHACPSPPCWHPAGSSAAHGMWLGPKGSDKIKARGCPRGWGALNPDNGWHPNTRGWQKWPWWFCVSPGPQSPRWGEEVFRSHGKGERRLWGSAVPSLVGHPGWSFPGGQHRGGLSPWARGPGWDGGSRRLPFQGPCSEAGGSPVPGKDGRGMGARQRDPQDPARTVLPWWAVPQWSSAPVFGVRDEGWRQREPPEAGFRGRGGG